MEEKPELSGKLGIVNNLLQVSGYRVSKLYFSLEPETCNLQQFIKKRRMTGNR
jgi:hypothetical protein